MCNISLIGECGINHNGSMDLAKQLIDQAHETGWNAVKFQKRDIDTVYTKEFLDAPRESPWGTTQRDQKQGLEFSVEQMGELFDYARGLGLQVGASAWDKKSLMEVESLEPDFHKVASAFITNEEFLISVALLNRHTYISTGMSTTADIGAAVRIFERINTPFTLLHCVSIYPCPEEWCNINFIRELQKTFCCPVGYSGHETGLLPSILAVACGATVIERHISLDRSMYGSDQSASLERRGMELLAKYIKAIPSTLGDGCKSMLPGEVECAMKLRYFECR